MPRKPPNQTEQDMELWHKVKATAKPLARKSKVALPPPAAAPKPAVPKTKEPNPAPLTPRKIDITPSLKPIPAPPRPKDETKGNVAGLDTATLDKLRKGLLPIAARLDLHGYIEEEAHLALSRFIRESHHNGRRCVLVITGKGSAGIKRPSGRGLLQENVPRWLKEAALKPLILHVTTARPNHGGAGALYVLLKKRR
jgi:DNA-nicking Smr family endonuclease